MNLNSENNIQKTIIVGSGPAAYSAALFLRDYNPILFEGGYFDGIGPGGQLTTTTHVDNYPGFPEGTMGPDLMENMKSQAKENGVKIISTFVKSIKKEKNVFIIKDDKNTYYSQTVVVATGASAKRLHAPGTDKFWTKGISACAVCDGAFFMDQACAVIGGGDTAMEESLFLSNICSKVYVIHRRNEFRARADKIDKVKETKNMEILTPYVLHSAHGKEELTSVKLRNVETDEIMDLKLDGLFFGIGHSPNTSFLKDENGKMTVDLHPNGYIKANEKMETSTEGMYACGDVQDYIYRQAVTAAASGCIAGRSCSEYLKKILNK